MVRLALRLLYKRRPIIPKWNHPLYANELSPFWQKGIAKGKYPVTRTTSYLEQGIRLRDCVKIMTINYGDYNTDTHDGTKDVAILNLQQFQYNNPNVQIECIENVTPTPFFTFFLDNGEKIVVDTEGKNQIEILKHIQKVVGKPKELIEIETAAVEENTANFGRYSKRKCICQVEGQVPCSSSIAGCPGHPNILAGKKRTMNVKKFPYGE